MPIVHDFAGQQEGMVPRYEWPARFLTCDAAMDDRLRQWRRAAIADREEFTRCQKASGGEREMAKFFKDCARRALRVERACTLALPHYGVPDRGQTALPVKLWPLELVGEMDAVAGRLILEFG